MKGYNIREIINSVSEMEKVVNLNKIYRNELKRMIDNPEFMHTFSKKPLLDLMRNCNKDLKLLLYLSTSANIVLTEELKKVNLVEN